MPSNHNWVCFDCLKVTRLAKPIDKVPHCNDCGKDLYFLSYKVEVPKKSDRKAWNLLREKCRERFFQTQEKNKINKTKRFHSIERDIRKLEALPENPGRRKQINLLKASLARLSI